MRPLAPTLALLASAAALAEPGATPTTWDLERYAELIVFAHVEAVARNPAVRNPSGEDSHLASLSPLEVWKGAAPARLVVTFTRDRACPGPPTYLVGHKVVAFLTRERGAWRTVGEYSGTKYPADVGARWELAELLQLARWEQEAGRTKPSMEWAIRATQRRSTRSEGLCVIAALRDRARLTGWPSPLDRRALRALKQVLVETPLYDDTTVDLLSLLEPDPSPRVTRDAADLVETALHYAAASEWWYVAVVEALGRRLGAPVTLTPPPPPREDLSLPAPTPFTSAVLVQPREARAEDAREHQRWQLETWRRFKAKHGLEPRVRSDFRWPPLDPRFGTSWDLEGSVPSLSSGFGLRRAAP